MAQKETKKRIILSEKLHNTDGGTKVKLIVHGEEMVERIVKRSGNSGRVYLPGVWVGSRVKIVRVE
ncbi:MAG: DUF2080 family transposase-associated protein [Deltaproteobacteria bacterium]|nr:DUF2080 family transposase-associated protein [Deltaproteobacteria bacterium]